MKFETQFKLVYLFVEGMGGKLYNCLEPKLTECSLAHDSGDTETANQMLTFIGEKIVELMEA